MMTERTGELFKCCLPGALEKWRRLMCGSEAAAAASSRLINNVDGKLGFANYLNILANSSSSCFAKTMLRVRRMEVQNKLLLTTRKDNLRGSCSLLHHHEVYDISRSKRFSVDSKSRISISLFLAQFGAIVVSRLSCAITSNFHYSTSNQVTHDGLSARPLRGRRLFLFSRAFEFTQRNAISSV